MTGITSMVTIDQIERFYKPYFLSQYLCGSNRPDTSHVIHEVFVQGKQVIIRVRALTDCGATSILAS
jgi:hypothetical protein